MFKGEEFNSSRTFELMTGSDTHGHLSLTEKSLKVTGNEASRSLSSIFILTSTETAGHR